MRSGVVGRKDKTQLLSQSPSYVPCTLSVSVGVHKAVYNDVFLLLKFKLRVAQKYMKEDIYDIKGN